MVFLEGFILLVEWRNVFKGFLFVSCFMRVRFLSDREYGFSLCSRCGDLWVNHLTSGSSKDAVFVCRTLNYRDSRDDDFEQVVFDDGLDDDW